MKKRPSNDDRIFIVDLSWAWSNVPAVRDVPVVERVTPLPRRPRTVVSSRRAEVIARYERGETSREVAETCGVGKTTVLGILKETGVRVRPRNVRY